MPYNNLSSVHKDVQLAIEMQCHFLHSKNPKTPSVLAIHKSLSSTFEDPDSCLHK